MTKRRPDPTPDELADWHLWRFSPFVDKTQVYDGRGREVSHREIREAFERLLGVAEQHLSPNNRSVQDGR